MAVSDAVEIHENVTPGRNCDWLTRSKHSSLFSASLVLEAKSRQAFAVQSELRESRPRLLLPHSAIQTPLSNSERLPTIQLVLKSVWSRDASQLVAGVMVDAIITACGI